MKMAASSLKAGWLSRKFVGKFVYLYAGEVLDQAA